MNMVQCTLRRGTTTQTAWLEEKDGLKVGAIAELKSENPGQEYGWEVLTVGTRLPAEVVQERSRDYKNTRKASDI